MTWGQADLRPLFYYAIICSDIMISGVANTVSTTKKDNLIILARVYISTANTCTYNIVKPHMLRKLRDNAYSSPSLDRIFVSYCGLLNYLAWCNYIINKEDMQSNYVLHLHIVTYVVF